MALAPGEEALAHQIGGVAGTLAAEIVAAARRVDGIDFSKRVGTVLLEAVVAQLQDEIARRQ